MKKLFTPPIILKSFIISFLITLLPCESKCQNNYSIKNEQNIKKLMIDDSTNDSYVSYGLTFIYCGYNKSNYEKELIIKSNIFFNINYRISNFFYKIEDHETQVGLFNEFGLKNFSIYFDFGPEVRMLQDLYLIPFGGVSLSLNNFYLINFYSYIGLRIGLIKRLSNKLTIGIESGLQFHVPETEFKTVYVKMGVGFNFF